MIIAQSDSESQLMVGVIEAETGASMIFTIRDDVSRTTMSNDVHAELENRNSISRFKTPSHPVLKDRSQMSLSLIHI